MRRLRRSLFHARCQHINLRDDAVLHDMLQIMQQVVEADVTLKTDGKQRAVIAMTIRHTVGCRQKQQYVTEICDVDVLSNGAC